MSYKEEFVYIIAMNGLEQSKHLEGLKEQSMPIEALRRTPELNTTSLTFYDEKSCQTIELCGAGTPQELQLMQQKVSEKIEDGATRKETDLEVPEEDLKILELAVNGVNRILAVNGIIRTFNFPPKRYHLSEGNLTTLLLSRALYFPDSHKIVSIINPVKPKEIKKKIEEVFHEVWHATSFSQFSLNKEGVNISKTAYQNFPDKTFTGFNEAITQMLCLNSINEMQEELLESFGLTYEDRVNIDQEGSYQTAMSTVGVIFQKIADIEGVPFEEVEKRAIQGYITGDEQIFSDIEKVFGGGSLFILSFLGKEQDVLGDKDIAIFEYFDASTEEERNTWIAERFPTYEKEVAHHSSFLTEDDGYHRRRLKYYEEEAKKNKEILERYKNLRNI